VEPQRHVYFLNGHVNVTLGKTPVRPRVALRPGRAHDIDLPARLEIRGLRSTPVGEEHHPAMYMKTRGGSAGARPAG